MYCKYTINFVNIIDLMGVLLASPARPVRFIIIYLKFFIESVVLVIFVIAMLVAGAIHY